MNGYKAFYHPALARMHREGSGMKTINWVPRGISNPYQWMAHIMGEPFSVGRIVEHEGAYWYEPARDMNKRYDFHLRAIKLEGIDTLQDAQAAAGMMILLRLKEST